MTHTTSKADSEPTPLYGGEGDDELHGGFGDADLLYGNAGTDTFLTRDQPGNRDISRGGGGSDIVLFEDGDDNFTQ